MTAVDSIEDILLIGAIVFTLVAGGIALRSRIRERGNRRRIARFIEKAKREYEAGLREQAKGQE